MPENRQSLYRTSDISELGKALDLTGHRYGRLSVVGFYDKRHNQTRWVCLCSCGSECVKYGNQMRSGQTVSCGCVQKEKASECGQSNAASLNGKKFSRLLVMGRKGSNSNQKATWRCLCDCGNEVVVPTSSLASGNTTSCGCYHKEMVSDMFTNHDLSEQDRLESRNREAAFPELRFWREAVYCLDNHACVVCGSSPSGKLVAHHKDGWNWCKERRLDRDNGVTLCCSCHDEFHQVYGYGNNTEAQWNQFLATREHLHVS